MKKVNWRKTLSVGLVSTMVLSAAPVSFSTRVQAADLPTAPVAANWGTTYQTMDGVGAAYAYTDSIGMMQLAMAGNQDTVRRLLDLTFDEKKGTGHDIVRVIVGDNGGLSTTNTSATSPGINPATGLLADVQHPGFDIQGNAIPMRGTSGQYGYKVESSNRYYDGNTDSIWPLEPEHGANELIPVQDFIWDYPSWNQPIANDDGGPTNLLSPPGSDPVVIKSTARTRKELFDFDQVWTMRQAMQYGVKQFYACTWTLPYWMSNSSSSSNVPNKIVRGDTATINGQTVKIYYQAYADYLVNYIRGMWEQWGIPITHINPFNEPDLAGGTAAYVTELIDSYIGPTLKKSMQPGGALYDIKNPDGKVIDFTPQLAALDGTNLAASLKLGGTAFAETDPGNVSDKNPYLDVFTTHLYGTVNIGTDETKLYHSGDFAQKPLDTSVDGSKYPSYLGNYKMWQAEFMNQDTSDGSAGAYTQRYGNQNINDAVRWSNLMTNMFTSNPGFNGYVWWSMWDSNGADGSDLIRFVHTNSQQNAGRTSTLTGEYRLFKRFYGYGHFSRFMKPGDVRFDVTRAPTQDINIVGFKNPNTNDFAMTVSNAKNDDSVQPLEFSLNNFPAGTNSVTVFRTSGSENQKKLASIPVTNGKFTINIPSASIVTIVPSQGTYATYDSLDGTDGGERDIFSSLEAETNDNGRTGNTAGNAGRDNEAVTLSDGQYLQYKNINFADGSANGGVVRRHLLYLNALAKADDGGALQAYVVPVNTPVNSTADLLSKGTRVADIQVPANNKFNVFQDMMDTGDLSAYGHKDLYILAAPNGSSGTITVDRFLFGANDSDWSSSANNSTVSIPGNILLNGDFDTATAPSASNWATGQFNNGSFALSVTGPTLAANEIQSYSGLSRYLKNGSTSKTAGSAKISGRTSGQGQYDGMYQVVTGKLTPGEKYSFEGYFLSMKSRPESYDIAAENPGDVKVALVYYDNNGVQLGMTPIGGRDMPEPYAAREAGDPAYWSNGQLVGRILAGGPVGLTSFQPVKVKVADWHESTSTPFTYSQPDGTAKVVLALYAEDDNILYADQLSLTPVTTPSYNLFIDGIQPSNFNANTTNYAYTVTGSSVPQVTAFTTEKDVKVSISQADSVVGTATVRFIKDQTVLKTFKVAFSTTEVVSFAGGLPNGWQVVNPTDAQNPLNSVSFSAAGATVATQKSDTDYPNSHNVLQFPGATDGNWTLTAKISVDKALSDASLTDNTQVGLGISKPATGEFFRVDAIRVGTSIKINTSGKSGSTPNSNTTSGTSLSGLDYYLRIVKTGNDAQAYYSTNGGSSYSALSSRSGSTVPTTFTPEFFQDAKLQLYAMNASAATDLQATFSNVTLVKSFDTGVISPDQQAVEQAASQIGSILTIPNAEGDDAATLKTKAQAMLNSDASLLSLGVTCIITDVDGVTSLNITKGNATLTGGSLTILAGGETIPPTWPQGSALAVSNVTADGVTLTWPLAQDASGIAGYKIYVDGGQPITVSDSVYSYDLKGLAGNTAYTFKVEAGDTKGNWTTNGPSTTATTLPTPDTTAPTWAPGGALVASNVTSTGVTLTWPMTAQDDTGVFQYKIFGGPETITVTGAVYSYDVTGLTPETGYTFKVEAGDQGGNWSSDGPSATVSTLKAPDSEAPVWAVGSTLAASNVTTTGVTLTWPAATDNTAVTGYKVYKGSEEVITLSASDHSYPVTGLTPGTSYLFSVQAVDAAGNWSSNGPTAEVTTESPDTAAPVWAEGSTLTASNVKTTGVTLTWTEAQDNVAVTGYKVYNGSDVIATLGAVNSYTVTGLKAATEYSFTVQAVDAAGNLSTGGPTAKVTTDKEPIVNNDNNGNNGNTSSGTPTSETVNSDTTVKVVTKVEAKADSAGKSSAVVTAQQVNDAVKKAVEEASKDNGSKAAVVEIKVNAPADAKAVETSLPKAAVSQAAESKVEAVTITTPVAAVTLDQKALAQVAKEATADIVINITKVDDTKISSETKQAVGDKPVYDFSVKSGDKAITSLGGKVEVAVPYSLKPGEDPNAVVLYSVASEGSPKVIMNGAYDADKQAVVFTTDATLTYAAGYNKVYFEDVKANDWYDNAVSFIAARNIANGTAEGQYSPDANLTRGQLITMLMRSYGIQPDAQASSNFADAGNTYYTGYLSAAKRLGISDGIGNNLFAPEKEITRQEMFTLLYNTLNVMGELPADAATGKSVTDYSDAAAIAPWAMDAMKLFVGTGTVSGSEGKLAPENMSNRAQMAQLLFNLLSR